jgi:hypothetical protein
VIYPRSRIESKRWSQNGDTKVTHGVDATTSEIESDRNKNCMCETSSKSRIVLCLNGFEFFRANLQ